MKNLKILLLIVSILLLLTLLMPRAHASLASIFGIDSLIKKETNQYQAELSALKVQNQGDISALKSRIDKLDITIQATMTTNAQLKADLAAQADITAGINNSVKAGRDTNTTTTNDTELMKKIIGGLVLVITSLIGLMKWQDMSYTKSAMAQDKQFFDYATNVLHDLVKEMTEQKETYKALLLQKLGIEYKPACKEAEQK